MRQNSRQSWVLAGGAMLTAVAISGCSDDSYPIDACRCSRIYISNSHQFSLASKDTGGVTLAPQAKLVKRISRDAIVLSNLRGESSRERYWNRSDASSKEGYFLHRCWGDPPLIPLGMDREEAIELALKLVEDADSEASARQDSDEDNSTND